MGQEGGSLVGIAICVLEGLTKVVDAKGCLASFPHKADELV